jgi:N-acetylmuramoyl-L-alanine amidase
MYKVYISPSTQEHNVGAGSYGTEEKRMNEIADILCPRLKEHGLIVKRNKPEMTLAQVVADSDAFGADSHIAIHSNATGSLSKARGSMVLICATGGRAEQLAKSISSELSAITPTTDRGVVVNNELYETRKPKAPSVIVEVDFHDNLEGAAWIIANKAEIAEALLKGILAHYGIKYIPPIAGTSTQNVSSWAKEAWSWGVQNKIVDGTNPQAPCTREQVVTMLYRLHQGNW